MLRNGEWRASAAAVALVAAAALASCGADETSATDPSPSEGRSSSSTPSQDAASAETEPVPPGTPKCSDVWQDGRRIPRVYAGCAEGDTFVKRDVLGCSSGQRMVSYANRFYGVLGGTVHEARQPLDEDREYAAATRRCRA